MSPARNRTNTLTLPSGSPDSPDSPDGDGSQEMGYQQTLMYGRYSKSLGDYAKEEAKRQKTNERMRKKEMEKRKRELTGDKKRGALYRRTSRVVTFVWKHTFAKLGEDWVFLAVLGVIMAVVSFIMDYGIETCNHSRLWLYEHLGDHIILQYFAWVLLPIFLVLFSAGFVHVMAPQAIGSGIPEMKTILRGVVLKEFLSGRTLVAKAVGLTATLGSGMPLGKEGPFVHIASIVATSLSKLVTSFKGIYANESKNSEMLAAACAVGVACCFGSPIGGVLFSIEVTSVFFAVRNYWRGFFSAVCGAMAFRLLAIWCNQEETIVAVFPTGFKTDFPFDPQELFVYAMIGVFCGLGGALYVYLHRRYVLWMRGNKRLTKFLQKNRFIYPFLVSWLISTLSFPPWTGQFQAGDIGTHEQIHILFSNYTWSKEPTEMSVDEWDHIKHWVTPYTSIFVNLTTYILFTFFTSILAATLPVPTGVLIPAFKVGAAFGRLIGEAMHVWFPDGVRYGNSIAYIIPGGYATVGAAAFTGAVTHTISISVIIFEMTGQITHCIPILIAVLIANAIASLLSPSCYDSIIMIKKLPYLPDILPSSSNAYNLYVEDFMLREIKYIWYGMTHKELREVLKDGKKLRSFPLVDSPDQMILLGSIQRMELISAIERHISHDRRVKVAAQRYEDAIKKDREEAMRRKEVERRKLQEKLEEEARKRQEEEEEEKRRKQKEEEDEEKKKKAASNNLDTPEGETASKKRRPSRFEVTTEDGATFVPVSNDAVVPPTIKETESLQDKLGIGGLDPDSPAGKALLQLSSKPKKSILKKSNSYTIHSFGIPGLSDPEERRGQSRPPINTSNSPYTTVTGGEKFRTALGNIQNIFKRSSQINLSRGDFGGGSPGSPGKRVGYTMDMSLEEQKEWEESEMEKAVRFEDCHIDPAPFHLVEKTSLLKVHSLFSMLGVNHAYVTALGRLIGVVGLKELRKSIEDANSGQSIAAKRNEQKMQQEQAQSPQVTVDSIESAMESGVVPLSTTNNQTSESESDNELLDRR